MTDKKTTKKKTTSKEKKVKDYPYNAFWGRLESIDSDIIGVKLADETEVVYISRTKSIVFKYPKEKFKKMFELQDKNDDKFYKFEWEEHEVRALVGGFKVAYDKLIESKPKPKSKSKKNKGDKK